MKFNRAILSIKDFKISNIVNQYEFFISWYEIDDLKSISYRSYDDQNNRLMKTIWYNFNKTIRRIQHQKNYLFDGKQYHFKENPHKIRIKNYAYHGYGDNTLMEIYEIQ